MTLVWKQLDSAIAFAAMAHAGQLRKYDNLPYITHPLRVMEILHANGAIVTEDQLVAAVLHDVVEDTFVGIETIERRFGSGVASMVFDLTDAFTSKAYPDLNRRARKDKERERLSGISSQAQDIKYADLIDNTRSIAANDPGFARLYLAEKEALLAVMRSGDPTLLALAEQTLAEAQAGLVQEALR